MQCILWHLATLYNVWRNICITWGPSAPKHRRGLSCWKGHVGLTVAEKAVGLISYSDVSAWHRAADEHTPAAVKLQNITLLTKKFVCKIADDGNSTHISLVRNGKEWYRYYADSYVRLYLNFFNCLKSYFIMRNTVTVLFEMCYINKLLTCITVFDYHSFITLQCNII